MDTPTAMSIPQVSCEVSVCETRHQISMCGGRVRIVERERQTHFYQSPCCKAHSGVQVVPVSFPSVSGGMLVWIAPMWSLVILLALAIHRALPQERVHRG
jgi:hypothetical protein